MSRLLSHNQVVRDQADFFQSDNFTRVTGLTSSALTLAVFFNNVPQPWPLVNGLGITDTQISSGRIYFNEVSGAPGYYSVRFMPNAIGYWRVLLIYTTGAQIAASDYDIVGGENDPDHGLRASFIREPC